MEEFTIEPWVMDVARAANSVGGRALLVGGFVRDRFLGLESKDYDFEIFGMSLAQLEEMLARYGEVISVGRSFGVLKVKGLEGDFSIPRRDSKTGDGHRGFLVELDPTLDFATAARRRDLTINSMGYDPLTGEILDPHGGRKDIALGVLRATDAETFREDPLRALRVAQFCARFDMMPDDDLLSICKGTDISDLPGERVFDEISKILIKSRAPSIGLNFLKESNLIRFFPELNALIGTEQDSKWHPEGDVWAHTMMVVDQASNLRNGDGDDIVLLLAALCHDLGKPATTKEEQGKISSPDHEKAGVEPTVKMLGRMRVSNDVVDKVSAMVQYHMAPAVLPRSNAGMKAYRKLARALAAAGVSLDLFYRLAQADQFGRGTERAKTREFQEGAVFLEKMLDVKKENPTSTDVVMGRHLVARGYQPSREFGQILSRCREIQDETGLTNPDSIIDIALGIDRARFLAKELTLVSASDIVLVTTKGNRDGVD